ncbi:hypothetical protein SAMN05216355_101625 [Actinomyces ruminicola]|uniref:Flp pilus-assembly TadE/G-like n=1 Tax=Actinomyces ruminicola TaxID=332524 RepID=A0A1H0A916_9ACTO|nr:hypothetical protein [Actinomyces ruminicola]SDN29714.1 hypothetical protein SAMN05216355_101625 [Actinomyces ruminicola]
MFAVHSIGSRRLRRLDSRLRDGERGAVNIFLVSVLVALLTVGMIIIIPLGDAIADRRNANTASDAAALAAAGYCADRLEDVYEDALEATDAETFWSYFGKPVFSYCSGASTQATRYASSNDATLTSYSQLSGLRFQVSVRMDDEIAETGLQSTSTATAKMTFEQGVCVSRGLLGVSVNGSCYTAPGVGFGQDTSTQKEEGTGSEGEEDAEEESFDLTDGLPDSATVKTRLV